GATREAKQQNAELHVKHEVRTFATTKRTMILVDSELYTGEGNNMCGAEDVRVDVRAVYELEKGKLGRALFHPHAIEASEVSGVFDLSNDGHIELMEKLFPERREVVGEDGVSACTIEIPFCDCPC